MRSEEELDDAIIDLERKIKLAEEIGFDETAVALKRTVNALKWVLEEIGNLSP